MSYTHLTDDELLLLVYAERIQDPLALEVAGRLDSTLDRLAATNYPSNPNLGKEAS